MLYKIEKLSKVLGRHCFKADYPVLQTLYTYLIIVLGSIRISQMLMHLLLYSIQRHEVGPWSCYRGT